MGTWYASGGAGACVSVQAHGGRLAGASLWAQSGGVGDSGLSYVKAQPCGVPAMGAQPCASRAVWRGAQPCGGASVWQRIHVRSHVGVPEYGSAAVWEQEHNRVRGIATVCAWEHSRVGAPTCGSAAM